MTQRFKIGDKVIVQNEEKMFAGEITKIMNSSICRLDNSMFYILFYSAQGTITKISENDYQILESYFKSAREFMNEILERENGNVSD